MLSLHDFFFSLEVVYASVLRVNVMTVSVTDLPTFLTTQLNSIVVFTRVGLLPRGRLTFQL